MRILFFIVCSFLLNDAYAVLNASSGTYSASISPQSNELILSDRSTEKTQVIQLTPHETARSVGIYNTDCFIGYTSGHLERRDIFTGVVTGHLFLAEYLNDCLVDEDAGRAYISCGTHLVEGSRATSGGQDNKIYLINLKKFSIQRIIYLKLCPGKLFKRDQLLVALNPVNESITVLNCNTFRVEQPLYVGNWPADFSCNEDHAFIATTYGIAILDPKLMTKVKFIQTPEPVRHLSIKDTKITAALRHAINIFDAKTFEFIQSINHSPIATLDFFPENYIYVQRNAKNATMVTQEFGLALIPFDPQPTPKNKEQIASEIREEIQNGNLWKYIDLSLDLQDVLHLGVYNKDEFIKDLHRKDEDLFVEVLAELTAHPIPLTAKQIQAYKASENPVGVLASYEENHHRALKNMVRTTLSSLNPYALSLMYLALKYELWGITKESTTRTHDFYHLGSDPRTIKSYEVANPT